MGLPFPEQPPFFEGHRNSWRKRQGPGPGIRKVQHYKRAWSGLNGGGTSLERQTKPTVKANVFVLQIIESLQILPTQGVSIMLRVILEKETSAWKVQLEEEGGGLRRLSRNRG